VLTGRDGAQPQPLGILPGWKTTNAFSPDGRYLLATVFNPTSQTAGVVSLGSTPGDRVAVLFDTEAQAPPRMIAQAAAVTEQFGAPFVSAAGFLASGPRAGQMILTWPEGNRHRTRLFDPTQPTPLADFTLDPLQDSLRFITQDPSTGALLFGWQEAVDPSAVGGIVLAHLDAGNHATVTHLELAAGSDLWNGWVREDRALYAVRNYDSALARYRYTLRSIPLGGLTGDDPGTVVFSSTVALPPPGAGLPLPTWHLGSQLLTYTTDSHELRARSYDGSLDFVLARDVRAIYDPIP
ncbi:MAG TPA: hypothetical protein VM536_01625, partial [Chloroflexia bacterium]|nr:hypothetical protein [Chloroflexia bacterium]